MKRLLALAALLLLAPAAAAHAQAAAETPSKGALYQDGPSGRYLLGGRWLLRLDPADAGERDRYQHQTSEAGWSPITVPNAWNARDESEDSMSGGVAWYRKDFRLPSGSRRLDWVVRFESVNYRAKVWLNGKPLDTHTGAYLPFEVRLPASALRRGDVNRLVVRTQNKRFPTDFPPSGKTRTGAPSGGWWNYGGLLREVYLRAVDRVDFGTVQVLPRLSCRTCPATVDVRATMRSSSRRAHRIAVTGRFGGRAFTLGSATLRPGRFTTFTQRVRVAHPRLWSPRSPTLYTTTLTAKADGQTVQRYGVHTGIRSIKVVHGKLTLNGRRVNFRGVGLHEDDPQAGFAIDDRIRAQLLDDARDVGATLIRAHYPLHPELMEMADRLGVLVWSEIPVYQIRTEYLKRLKVRKLAARYVEQNVLTNGNHASIVTWSIGNELSSRPGPVQGDYLARAARTAKALDPTRPVAYAVAGYPAAGCQARYYAPLDILGINDYFGWYPGPNGQIADRSTLSAYLDGVRRCYPDKAIVVSEFGAEANRHGPVEEKGTYEFQQDFVTYHLGVYATKPWLSGAIYWALKEFRVRPRWDGGNPRPQPPIHQKGLVAFDGSRKPAFFDVQRLYRATDQYPGG